MMNLKAGLLLATVGTASWMSLPNQHIESPFNVAPVETIERVIPTERIGTGIGDTAPEIALKNPKGRTITLSSLRGNLVLVDFWASWCGPCRRENPNMVRAYNKYKKARFKVAEGFEVYSVSLDSDVGRWEAAIKKDGLVWKEHVSDLKRWNSEAAAVYGVNSIPMSFLVDQNGVIIAKNLRGIELHRQIDRHVAKL